MVSLQERPAFLAAPHPVCVQPSRPTDQAILCDSEQFLHLTRSKSPSPHCYASTRSGPSLSLWPLVLLLSAHQPHRLLCCPSNIPGNFHLGALSTGCTLACSVLLQIAMWLSLLKHHCLSQASLWHSVKSFSPFPSTSSAFFFPS